MRLAGPNGADWRCGACFSCKLHSAGSPQGFWPFTLLMSYWAPKSGGSNCFGFFTRVVQTGGISFLDKRVENEGKAGKGESRRCLDHFVCLSGRRWEKRFRSGLTFRVLFVYWSPWIRGQAVRTCLRVVRLSPLTPGLTDLRPDAGSALWPLGLVSVLLLN